MEQQIASLVKMPLYHTALRLAFQQRNSALNYVVSIKLEG